MGSKEPNHQLQVHAAIVIDQEKDPRTSSGERHLAMACVLHAPTSPTLPFMPNQHTSRHMQTGTHDVSTFRNRVGGG